MAQTTDFIIDNGTGAEVRTDINNALMALATTNTGSTAPSNPVFGMLWVDTSTASLKIYAGNDVWLIIIDSVAATSTSGASASFASGTKMIFHQVTIPTGWTQETIEGAALRVVSGTPGGTGGVVDFGGWLSGHIHSVASTVSYATGASSHSLGSATPSSSPKYTDVMICKKS